MSDTVVITKQLGGSEDLTIGIGTETQSRGGNPLPITRINPTEILGAIVVSTIAEMEALVIADLGDTKTVIVQDNSRGGIFTYRVDNTLTSDNGTIFGSTVIDSYWVRQYSGPINVKWFGDTSLEQTFKDASDVSQSVEVDVGTYTLDLDTIVFTGIKFHSFGVVTINTNTTLTVVNLVP